MTEGSLSLAEKRELVELLEERARRKRQNRINDLFPDDGELARSGYVKHLEFFDVGTDYRERLFLAGNRVGKTVVGGSETSYHLTGLYPDWWTGRKFDHPVDWWAAGDTNETTRDIIQQELIGPIIDEGTGLIPGDLILSTTRRAGVPNAYQTIDVRHVSGGVSKLGLKSYDQKRKSFQGTAKHGIWLDEEPPLEIYSECLMRTMTTNGMIILTFTPLLGISDVVKMFLPEGRVCDAN